MTIYALLVGINKYQDEKNISELQGCENDVDLFSETLKNRFGVKGDDNYLKIKTLKTTCATRKNVIRHFKSHLIDQVEKEDVAIFYFSGHGAQSLTYPLLNDMEADGLDESLVCYNSRCNGEPDLRDKDLSYLLTKLEATGCKNISVFLDSCHSGHGTRVIGSDTSRTRLTNIDETKYSWQSYLFAEENPTPSNSEEAAEQLKKQIPKHVKHFLMSGCRDDQLSIEQRQGADRKYHGIFTHTLCEALNTIQYPVSYHELRSRVLARIQTKQPNQTPQLETVGGAKGLEPIFGGSHLLPIKLLVSYDNGHWLVNVGAIHGFNLGDELGLFDTGQPEDTGEVVKVTISELNSTKSVLNIVNAGDLDEQKQYNAVVTNRKFEKLRFGFNGNEEQLNSIKAFLSEADQSDNSMVGHFVEYEASNSDYELHSSNGLYYVTHFGDTRPLFEKKEDVKEVLKQLAIIARWKQKLAIDNPSSSLAQDDLVEITVSYSDPITQKFVEKKSEDVTLSYTLQENGTWKEPKYTLKYSLKKPSIKKKLYCALLWFDGADNCIYGNDVYEALANSSGVLDNTGSASILELTAYDNTASLSDSLHKQGVTKVQDVLKIIISEEEFDTNLLTQEGNELYVGNKGLAGGDRSTNSLPSVLDVLANTVHHRGPGSAVKNEVKLIDWYTKSIGLTIIRPQEAQAVNSDSAITLSSDGNTTIQVEPHPTFNGKLRTVNSYDEAVQGHSSHSSEDKEKVRVPQPKVFAQDTTSSVISFSAGIGTDMGLDAVEIALGSTTKSVGNAGEVSAEAPLVFTVNQEQQTGEYIIPYVYDEENDFFLPIGKSISKDGTTQIQIESIPEHIAKVSPGTKSLGRALKVYFRKLIFQDILGREIDIYQLRIPEFDGTDLTGRVRKYESNESVIQKRVAESQKILLVLHGIIGSTDSLAGFVNHKLNDGSSLHNDYDLVVTFDYENLNTPIKDIAKALKTNLQNIGIAAGTDKQVDIVAHSMGGLVSRYLIEHDGGEKFINHLVMVGTPNGGSPYASVKDKGVDLLNTWAYTNVAIILNGLTSPLVGATVIGSFMKLLDQIDNNLDQMSPDSDFLQILLSSEQPDTHYSLVEGFVHDEKASVNQDDSRLSRLFQYLGGRLKLKAYEQLTDRLFKESNDIAASSSSMKSFNPAWQGAVSVQEVSCDHLSYFVDAEAINFIADQLRKK